MTAPDAPQRGVDRRGFLRLGGLGIVGTAVLAACSGGSGEQAMTSVPLALPAAPVGTPGNDVALLQTALSLELLLGEVYRQSAATGLVASEAGGDSLTAFENHHQVHAEVLAAAVTDRAGEPVNTGNAIVRAALVDPAAASWAVEADVLAVARTLEELATQTAVFATTVVTTSELRTLLMSIGGAANRRQAILASLTSVDAFEVGGAFVPSADPLPVGALIDDWR
jgi:hypothetical protein